MNLPTIALPSFWPIALALLAFGTLGFRRGWVRELATLGGLLLSWLIVVALGLTLVDWANKVVLIARFTWDGGFEVADPTGLLRTLRAEPAIDPWQPELFLLVVFALGVIGAYYAGGRLAAGPGATSDAVLGALGGALNGYVLAYVVLSYLGVGQRLPAPVGLAATDAVGPHLTTVAIVVVAGAVGIALLTGLRGASMRRGRAGG
jgi:hypothetical protein